MMSVTAPNADGELAQRNLDVRLMLAGVMDFLLTTPPPTSAPLAPPARPPGAVVPV